MTYQFKSLTGRCMLALASLLVITGLCLLFIGFIGQFIEYALGLLSQATGAAMHHLHITPLH